MAASPASTSTVTQSPLFATPVTPLDPARAKRKYVKLVDAIISAGCDIKVHAEDAIRRVGQSRQFDAQADTTVETIDRLAYRIAVEADAINHEPLLLLAGRIRRQCAAYRVHDSAEDRLIADATSIIHRICQIARGLCTAITRSQGERVPSRKGEGR